ncbi:hypothetical protein [Methylocystis parvus]|uniref:Uncharacterized protein n=1 Tax=Methylocystis parvus TaxID=134 RepID=A0A6B8M237_9HYPH|nr:hypothetical protein [Methylocystis parvus]QGM97874.1 hypothetical protein F7D14_10600 [Methylocystis parvus]WBK01817.1 hypothetical protein MMG94_08980 [Methylocystis parvus OBBP]
MAEKPAAHIVHETPSRLRLRIPEKRHDKAFFAEVSRRLGDRADLAVEANATTASVLIVSEHARDAVRALGESTPFALVDAPPETGLSLPQLRLQVETANQRFSRFFGGDARSFVILALMGASLLQFARGRTLAPAVTLLWYASEGLRLWSPNRDRQSR